MPRAEIPPHRYTAAFADRIETGLAGPLGARRDVPDAQPGRRPQPGFRRGGRPAQAVRARHVPYPSGVGPARRPPARLHRHRRLRPLPADERPQRGPHDGLRRVRPARRAVRRADRPAPADHHRGQHRHDASPVAPPGDGLRPSPVDRDHRRGLLPLDAVDLPADLQLLVRRRRGPGPPDRRPDRRARRRGPRAGRGHQPVRPPVGRAIGDRTAGGRRQPPAGLRQRGAGQLVPGPGHRARQRGGHGRRPQRPGQLPGVQAPAEAVDDADHRVRGPADR